MKKQHPSDIEFYRIRRNLNKILLPMTWPERRAYIHKKATQFANTVLDPKYHTPEREAEQEAYVKEALEKYRAQKAAEAAQAALVFGEDSAEYKTQTT